MSPTARILVVEDEGIVAMDIQNSLELLGYPEPAVAGSGEEAVERARMYRPDLILMDIRLGEGMDGIEASMAIAEYLDVPVVYLTAYTDAETVERARMSMPFGYLVKPFDPKELQTTIEMALYRHELEAQLKERERWLSATLRSIGDGVVATGQDGKVMFMNPRAAAMTGWSEAEALEADLEEVVPLQDGQGKALALHPGRRALDLGRPVSSPEEVSLVSRNGSSLPVEDTAAPIQGIRGAMDGLVVVLKDASRRREAAQERRSEDQTLQARKLEAMGRFAGGIAHDFNNHLSVILGMSELLAGGLDGEPSMQELVGEIRKACLSSVHLTRKLRSFSRRETYNPRPIDINASVRAAEQMLRPVMDAGIQLRTEVSSPAPIHCDPECLEQAILDLACHSLERLAEGGTLTLATGQETLKDLESLVFAPIPGPYAYVRVSDTGPDLPADAQDHLFDAFHLSQSGDQGAGPGLSTLHALVKRMGGNIRVRPAEGVGITLYFPLLISP